MKKSRFTNEQAALRMRLKEPTDNAFIESFNGRERPVNRMVQFTVAFAC
jgi:hypothetical protein